MNTLTVILGLASLQLLAAGIHILKESCEAKYPEMMKFIEAFIRHNGSAYDFLESSKISKENYCYFKCVIEEYGWYADGEFDMYEILKTTEEFMDFVGEEQFKVIRKQISGVKGEDDCERAFLIVKTLAEISIKYTQGPSDKKTS